MIESSQCTLNITSVIQNSGSQSFFHFPPLQTQTLSNAPQQKQKSQKDNCKYFTLPTVKKQYRRSGSAQTIHSSLGKIHFQRHVIAYDVILLSPQWHGLFKRKQTHSLCFLYILNLPMRHPFRHISTKDSPSRAIFLHQRDQIDACRVYFIHQIYQYIICTSKRC